MDTLQNIVADFVGKNLNHYKKALRYHPEIQSIVYGRGCYKIINQYYEKEDVMPFNILIEKLDGLSNLIIDFVKESKEIDTIRRIESTFSPSILKLLLKCIYANIGIAVDLCNKIQDEKAAAAELSWNGEYEDGLGIVRNVVQDFEKAKHTIFLKNRKYAPLFKKALGKKLGDITSQKDNVSTRFGIDELVGSRTAD